MTKQEFLDAIKHYQEAQTIQDRFTEEFDLNIFDSKLVTSYEAMFEILMTSILGEEGWDMLAWWLYEDGRVAYAEDGATIPLDTLEQLWDNLLYEYCRTKKTEC